MSENKEIQEQEVSTEESTSDEAVSTEETSEESVEETPVSDDSTVEEGDDENKLTVSHYVGVSTPEDEVHRPAMPLSASELDELRSKGVEEDDLGGDGLLVGLVGLVAIVGVIFVGVAVFFAVNVVSEQANKDADTDPRLATVQENAREALTSYSRGEDGLYTVPTEIAASILEANPTLLQQHPSGTAPEARPLPAPAVPVVVPAAAAPEAVLGENGDILAAAEGTLEGLEAAAEAGAEAAPSDAAPAAEADAAEAVVEQVEAPAAE